MRIRAYICKRKGQWEVSCGPRTYGCATFGAAHLAAITLKARYERDIKDAAEWERATASGIHNDGSWLRKRSNG